jgi:hypothetical protein
MIRFISSIGLSLILLIPMTSQAALLFDGVLDWEGIAGDLTYDSGTNRLYITGFDITIHSLLFHGQEEWGDTWDSGEIHVTAQNSITIDGLFEAPGSTVFLTGGSISLLAGSELFVGEDYGDGSGGSEIASGNVSLCSGGDCEYLDSQLGSVRLIVGSGERIDFDQSGISFVPGDLQLAAPVPAAIWLLGTGLAGLGLIRRKLRRV